MAVRKNLSHPQIVRDRIRTTQIIKRLTHFVLGEANGADPCIMEPHQVTAALGLLKKTLPDLQAVDTTLHGDPLAPIVISQTDGKL